MNPRYVRPLTSDERQAVELLWKKSPSHLERLRAECILLSARGVHVSELCRLTRFARSSVGRTLKAFEKLGVTGLLNPKREGRPARCSNEDEQFLLDLLIRSPRDRGYGTNTWITKLLAEELKRQRGVELKPEGVRALLRRLGARQVRADHYLSRADEAEKGGTRRTE